MAVLVKVLPQFLLRLFVPMLLLCLAAWAIMSFIPFVRKQVRPVFSFSDGRGRRLPPVQCVVIAFVMVVCTLFSGKNTNNVQNLPPRPMLQLPAPTPPSIFDYPRTVTETRAASGFALVGVGTNETFTFDPPTNATVCADWRMYGSASRWTHVSSTNFAFPFGGTNATTFTFLPGGVAELAGGADAPRVAPFDAKMGIAPERYWDSLGVTSRFWTATTPSNTFLATWQGALLNRGTDNPMDVQMELFPDGGFDFRYDLSRLPSDDALAGARVAAWNAGGGETYSVPHRNLTSARWRPVAPDDALTPDRDNDGVTTVDELFFLGTDPGNPDSAFDGLPDGDEIAHGLNPLDPFSNGGPYADGFALKIGDLNPLASPQGSDYTYYEHVVYSGSTNGTVSLPDSTASTAVLEVEVSGSGTDDLVVGMQSLPLVGGVSPVYLAVPRGSRLAVRVRRRTGSHGRRSVRLDLLPAHKDRPRNRVHPRPLRAQDYGADRPRPWCIGPLLPLVGKRRRGRVEPRGRRVRHTHGQFRREPHGARVVRARPSAVPVRKLLPSAECAVLPAPVRRRRRAGG